jgi:KipI family sensor histidine kinase inhibitor
LAKELLVSSLPELRVLGWRAYGAIGVLAEFGSSVETLEAYRRCVGGLFDECVPGAQTIYFESSRLGTSKVVSLVNGLLQQPSSEMFDSIVREHSIEVCYDGADLENVASLTGFSVEEVIRRHSAAVYTVAFLGFSRSFPYLAGLDPAIEVPRLATPRTLVPAGSVGMGAGYTGVYPMSSPGGWQLLGRTDAVLFDSTNDPPSILKTGDLVRFVRV